MGDPAVVAARARPRLGTIARKDKRGNHPLLLLSLTTLLLISLGLALQVISLLGIAQRDAARSPVTTESAGEAKLRWQPVHDNPAPGYPDASVVVIDPLTEGAPLPPGLSTWPEPGQAVLSPALLADGVEIESRYGEFAGTIGQDGLVSPDEYLVYVRPDGQEPTGSFLLVTDFGANQGGMISSEFADISQRIWDTVWFAFFFSLSALLLMYVTARFDLEQRRKTELLLLALGYPRRKRVRWRCAQLVRPLLNAFGIAAALLALTVLIDIRLPGLSPPFMAADARRWWWAIAGAEALVLLIYVLVDLRMTVRAGALLMSNRPTEKARAYSPLRAKLCVASAALSLVAFWVSLHVAPMWLFGIYLVFFAVIIIFLRDLVGAVIHVVARRQTKHGLKANSAADLIAGRSLLASLRSATGYATVVAAITILTCQFSLVTNAHDDNFPEIVDTYEQLDGMIAEVRINRGMSTEAYRGVIDTLRAQYPQVEVAVTRMTTEVEAETIDITTEVFTSDPALSKLEGSSIEPWRRYVHWARLDGTEGEVSTGTLEDFLGGLTNGEHFDEGPPVIVLYSADGRLPVPEIKAHLSTMVLPFGRVVTPGELEYSTAIYNLKLARWLGYATGIALASALVAMFIAMFADLVRQARALAPFAACSGNRDVVGSVIRRRLFVPVTVALAISTVFALTIAHISFIMVHVGIGHVFPILLAAYLVSLVVMAGAATWASRYATHYTSTWKPGKE